MSTLTCPNCKYANAQGARYCVQCGTFLLTAAPPSIPASPPTPSFPPYAGLPPAPFPYSPAQQPGFLEAKRREKIGNTRTGLLLVALGTFLGLGSLLSYLGYRGLSGLILIAGQLLLAGIGGLLAIIGMIFVILGREAFGKEHSDRVIWSIILYLVGNAITVITTFLYTFTVGLILVTGQPSANTLISDFYTLLIGNLAGTAISGLAYVLVTSTIQQPLGHRLLWTGYLGSLAIAVAAILVVGPLAQDTIRNALSTGTPDQIALIGLSGQVSSFTELNSIPKAVYAVAYLLARSNITPGQHGFTAPSETLPPSN